MEVLLLILGVVAILYVSVFLQLLFIKVWIWMFTPMIYWMFPNLRLVFSNLIGDRQRQTPEMKANEERMHARLDREKREREEEENDPPKSPKPMILDSQNNVAARAERRLLSEENIS